MSPLQLNTAHQGEWDCTTCVKTYNTANDQLWETVREGAPVCEQCIQALFELALRFDYEWPARFGPDELQILDFQSILPAQLYDALMQKVDEMALLDQTPDLTIVEEQTRGKDYQLCPGCTKIRCLGSGCNHIICPCKASFCFICGDAVPADSNHWAIGICPRYGPPGSDMFDTDMPDDELTEEEEAAEDRRRMVQRTIFHLGSWSFNVAMQSLETDDLGQELLRRALLPAHARHVLRRPQYNDVVALLRQHSPVHAVPEREWEALVSGRPGGEQVRDLLVDGPQGENHPTHDFLDRGILREPVGGVFNMMSENSRLEAFLWMMNIIEEWDANVDNGRPHSSAVFGMGPGGDEDMRVLVGWSQSRMHHHDNRFTYTPMQNAGLLVTITRPRRIADVDGTAINPPEAFWRLELLRRLWGFMIHLDEEFGETDSGNAMWVDLHRDASRAFEQQAPGATFEDWSFGF